MSTEDASSSGAGSGSSGRDAIYLWMAVWFY